MFTGILTTDNGPHSFEKLAYATGSMLALAFEVKPDSPKFIDIEMAKDALRLAVTKIMLKHHKEAQEAERDILAKGENPGRVNELLDASEHTEVEEAVVEIRAACEDLLKLVSNKEVVPVKEGTFDHLTFEDHLMTIIRQRVEMDLHTAMNIERQWHADRNPDCPHCKAFKEGKGPIQIDENLIV